jgi:hypothetical protein
MKSLKNILLFLRLKGSYRELARERRWNSKNYQEVTKRESGKG